MSGTVPTTALLGDMIFKTNEYSVQGSTGTTSSTSEDLNGGASFTVVVCRGLPSDFILRNLFVNVDGPAALVRAEELLV